MKTAPKREPLHRVSTTPQYLRTAKALLLRRRTKEAINLLLRGLNLDPCCSEATLLLCKALVAVKRLPEARQRLQKLLEVEDLVKGWVLLVRVHMAEGDLSAAAEVVRSALDRHPQDEHLQALSIRLENDPDNSGVATLRVDRMPDEALEAAEDAPTARAPQSQIFRLLKQELPEVVIPLPTACVTPSDSDTRPDATVEEQQGSGETTVRSPALAVVLAESLQSQPRQATEWLTSLQSQPCRATDGLFSAESEVPVQPKVDEDEEELGGTIESTPMPSDELDFDGVQTRLRVSTAPDLTSALQQAAIALREQAGRRQSVDGDTDDSTPPASLAARRRVKHRQSQLLPAIQQPLLPQPASATIRLKAPKPGLARWWPLLLGLAFWCIGASTVGSLLLRRFSLARQHVAAARELAYQDEQEALRAALHRLRAAANLSGRRPESLALAAAIHGRLAVEFGESDLDTTESLLEEALRRGAENNPRAAEDVALARAYLLLGRNPLPDAVAFLFKSLEHQPESIPMLLLYADALILNGEHYLASRVLEKLPASDGRVLHRMGCVLFRQGRTAQAEAVVRTAVRHGLAARDGELMLARMKVNADRSETRILSTVERLTHDRQLSSRQRSWANLLAAILQHRLGKRDLARFSLSRALVARPLGDVDFRLTAGELLLQLHDLEAAFGEASEGARQAPRDQRLVELLARIELAMDRPRSALRRLLAVEELAPEGRLTLAAAELRVGELDQARQVLAGTATKPSRRAAYLGIRIELASGNLRAARRLLAKLSARKGELDAEAYLLRGLTALANNDTDEASRSFRAALSRDPEQPEALLELGRLGKRRFDARAARNFLEQAVAANPYLRTARLELAELLEQIGDFAAAQRQYDEAQLLDPSSLAALLGRARSAVELGSSNASALVESIRARGQRATADLLAARLLMLREDWGNAIERLERLARRPGEQQSEAVLWLAQSLLRGGNLAAAELAFEQAAERGKSPEAHLGFSQIDLRRGQVKSAVLHATVALEELAGRMYPTSLRSSVKLQLARCHRRAESLGAAIVNLQDVLELDRQSFGAHLELGEIYASLGKSNRAVQHLASALRLNDQSKEAREHLTRLCHGHQLTGCPSDE